MLPKNEVPSQAHGIPSAKGVEPQRQTDLGMTQSLAFLPGHWSEHFVLWPVDQIFISVDAKALPC